MPEPYTNETVPEEIENDWTQYAVTVNCFGEVGFNQNIGFPDKCL